MIPQKKLVVLSGAGISAESGLKTFRDANGLWEGHDVMQVASPEGWFKNPKLVLEFYNQRRAQLKQVFPNEAHKILAQLEKQFDTTIITQNVDNLHERAGSTHVLHLHGELCKVRSTGNERLVYAWEDDLNWGDLCEQGHQLRPHIVWFGEMVPAMETAVDIVRQADFLLIIGTSLQVYPAAGLVGFSNAEKIYYIDPRPNINYELSNQNFELIEMNAVDGMKSLKPKLLNITL